MGDKNRMISGSICLTDLIEKANAGHSAFTRGKKNGKIYVNVIVWQNEEPDDNGNDFAMQLSSTKEKREDGSEKKAVYIGNLKYLKPKGEVQQEHEAVAPGSASVQLRDDLPF